MATRALSLFVALRPRRRDDVSDERRFVVLAVFLELQVGDVLAHLAQLPSFGHFEEPLGVGRRELEEAELHQILPRQVREERARLRRREIARVHGCRLHRVLRRQDD